MCVIFLSSTCASAESALTFSRVFEKFFFIHIKNFHLDRHIMYNAPVKGRIFNLNVNLQWAKQIDSKTISWANQSFQQDGCIFCAYLTFLQLQSSDSLKTFQSQIFIQRADLFREREDLFSLSFCLLSPISYLLVTQLDVHPARLKYKLNQLK